LIVIALEFVLLQQHHLGTLWNFDTNSLKTLGFSDKLENFSVKIDKKFSRSRMSHNQSCLKSGLGRFDALAPSMMPKSFKFNQRSCDFVVSSNDFL
jgi:hypothetical protein